MEKDLISLVEALETKGEAMTLTAGISMRPMLRQGRDIVIIETVKRKLQKYDVPVYKRPNHDKYVMHRILKVTEDGYVIRGDNLMHKEYDIKDEHIVGVLKAFYREGRYYDCATSKKYKVYIILNRLSFPLRFVWSKMRGAVTKFLSLVLPKPVKEYIKKKILKI